jgi:hypothetical protein
LKEKPMHPAPALAVSLLAAALAGCGDQPEQKQTPIKVTGPEQQQLHQLDAINLAIALKRAIYGAGYTCKTITDAGFVAAYQNLDMWTAHCTNDKFPARDWAIFAGPDGSAQVRDCKDVRASGLPACEIKQRPKGSFNKL